MLSLGLKTKLGIIGLGSVVHSLALCRLVNISDYAFPILNTDSGKNCSHSNRLWLRVGVIARLVFVLY